MIATSQPPAREAAAGALLRSDDADLRALSVLGQHPQTIDVAAVAQAVLLRAAEARSTAGMGASTGSLALERSLAREETGTEFGNILDVLAEGPKDGPARALARALAALGLLSTASAPEPRALADALLWLAAHTAFDATSLIDEVLGIDADPLWETVAARARSEGDNGGLERGEALVAAFALAGSRSAKAHQLAAALASGNVDPVLARALAPRVDGPPRTVQGEMARRPRGPLAAACFALTGISALLLSVGVLQRAALAYRRPAALNVSQDGAVRIQWTSELLGRVMTDHDELISRDALLRASRTVRYPRVALYAGLLALCVGSIAGVSAFVEGVRASSPSLLVTGLLFATFGVAIDFVLSTVLPGRSGRCHLLVVSRDRAVLCIALSIDDANSVLNHLAQRQSESSTASA